MSIAVAAFATAEELNDIAVANPNIPKNKHTLASNFCIVNLHCKTKRKVPADIGKAKLRYLSTPHKVAYDLDGLARTVTDGATLAFSGKRLNLIVI